jgi:hypothetical protein
MPQLIYTANRQPVKTGDIVHIRNTPYTVTGTAEPHSPASTGRVYVQAMNEGRMTAEYFPNVIGAEWINRTDR